MTQASRRDELSFNWKLPTLCDYSVNSPRDLALSKVATFPSWTWIFVWARRTASPLQQPPISTSTSSETHRLAQVVHTTPSPLPHTSNDLTTTKPLQRASHLHPPVPARCMEDQHRLRPRIHTTQPFPLFPGPFSFVIYPAQAAPDTLFSLAKARDR